MIRLLLPILILFFLSCASEEDKKAKIDNLYSDIRNIPSSKPCENLKGYEKLKSLESRYGTEYYKVTIAQKISRYEKECEQLKQKKEKERLRLAELNKLGDWSVGNYVDEFGDKTGEKFISNQIIGSFSNTATENSSLRAVMMLSGENIIEPWFRLYEYNGTNSIKGFYSKTHYYPCKVKSGSGDVFKLKLYIRDGWNYFHIDEPSSKWDKEYQGAREKLVFLIREGNSAKFSCYDSERSSSTYRFDFDFSYYDNALRKLKEN